MKKINIILGILLVFFTSLSANNKSVNLQLSWKHQFQFAGYYIAKEKGFYNDIGVDVNIKEYDFNIDVMSDTLTQKNHFSIGRSPLILEKLNGKDILLMSSIFQKTPLVLLTNKKVKKLSDLKNKRMMVTDNIDMASINAMLMSAGVDSNSFIKQKHTFNVDDLIDNKTDALVSYISNEPYQLNKKNSEYNIFAPSNFDFDFYSDILYTSSKLYKENPYLVASFNEASLKGWQYAFDNIEETVDLILNKYNTQNRTKEALLFEAKELKKLAYVNNIPLGNITLSKIKQISQVYRLLELTTNTTNFENFIYKKSNDNLHLSIEEKKWIKHNPLVKIAVMNYWKSDNAGNNIHTDLINLMNEYGNLNIVPIKYNSWKNGFNDASEGQNIHGVMNLAWSKERAEKYFDYSQGYYFIPHYLVVRKDNNTIKSMKDLIKKTVYVKEKNITKIRVENYSSDIKIIELKNNEDLLKSLSSKKEADAIIMSSLDPKVLDKYNLKIAKPIYDKYNQGHVGINHKHKILHSIIGKVLSAIPTSKLSELQQKKYEKSKKESIPKIDLTKKEKAFILKHPTIRVHNEKSWAPFNFYEKGRARGLSIDYIKLLAKKVGINIEFVTGPTWGEFIEQAKNKDIDLLLNIVHNKEREKFLNFTESYSKLFQSLYIRTGEKKIKDISELFGKTFAVPKGFIYETQLKKYPKIKLLVLDDTLSCIQAVSSGRAYAMMDISNVVNYYKNKYSIDNITLGGTIGLEGKPLILKMGVREDWPELVSILNKAFLDLSEEEISKIENSWLFNKKTSKIKKIDLTKNEKSWIDNNTVLVGGEVDWPPFDFVNDKGKYVGVSKDLLDLISKKTGLKLQYKTGQTWKELLSDFKEGKLDILPALYKNKERDKYTTYTKSYCKVSDYVFMRKDDKPIKSLDELENKTIALVDGYATLEKLSLKYPKLKFHRVKTMQEALNALLSKKADVYIDSYAVVKFYLASAMQVDIKAVLPVVLNQNMLHIGINKEKQVLSNIINKAMKDISKNEINEILSKWFNQDNINTIDFTEKEVDWIKENRILKYSEINWKPLSIIENNTMNGIMADYMKIIEKYTGIEFKFEKAKSWPDVLDKFRKGEIDIVPSVIGTKEDKKMGLVSDIYATYPMSIITNENIKYVSSLSEIKDKTFSLPKYYESYNLIKKYYPDAKIIETNSIEEALKNVSDKKADIFIGHIAAALFYIEKIGRDNLKIAGNTQFEFTHHFLISKQYPELVSIVNKVFDTLTQKDRDTIYHNWVHTEIKQSFDYSILWKISGGFLLFLFVVVYYSRKIKLQKEFVQTLLDSQEQIIITTNGKRLKSANKTFFNFYNLSSVELFMNKFGDCICDTFDKNSPEGYLQKYMEEKTWIEYILSHSNQSHKAQIFLNNTLFIFSVTASILPNKDNLMSAVFTDITEMEKAKEEVELILSNILLPVLITSQKERKILYANKYAQKQYDLPLDEIIGSDIDDVYTVKGQQAHIIEAIKRDGFIENSEEIFKTSSGKEFTALLSVTPIIYQNKASYIGMITDITKQKEIEQKTKIQEIQMRTLVDAIPSVIFMKDQEGKHLLVNKFYTESTGILSDEIIGKTDFDVMPEDIAKSITDVDKKVISSKQTLTYEESVPSLDGTSKFYLTSKVPLIDEDENVSGMVGIATDITASKELQKEIESIHKHTRDSIEYASLIQQAIVPDDTELTKYFQDHFTIWNPKDIVGGDIYLFEELRDEDECLLMVIDCTGHGVPGAFVTMLVKAIERQVIAKINNDKNIDVSPAWILKYFNKTMKILLKQEDTSSQSNAGFDGGIIYYNKKDKILKFSGAETALFYTEDKELKTIKGNRHSIGYKKSDINYEFKEHIIEVKDGMDFYITTDGYLDQNGGSKGFPFGKKNFVRIIKENQEQSFEKQKDSLLNELVEYQGKEERNDDVTIVGIKI